MMEFKLNILKPKLVFFLFFFTSLIWLFSLFWYKSNVADYTGPHQIVSSKAFLAELHNKAPDGCIALLYMDRVDIILVGSSSAYANIDPYVLSKEFENQAVGVCALPAWNADFFEYFFNFLQENEIHPKRIIWLADQYSPLELSNHDKRKANAQSAFSDETLQQEKSEEWVSKYSAQGFSTDQIIADYSDTIKTHTKEIEALSAETVSSIIRATNFPSNAALATILETAKPNPDNGEKMRQICAYTQQHSIVLDVVISPIPKETETMFIEAFKILNPLGGMDVKEYYGKYLECNNNLVVTSLENWGLDSRYYINRRLEPNYPYEIWSDNDTFQQQYRSMDVRLRRKLYDESHMNGVGAVLFSKQLVDAIK